MADLIDGIENQGTEGVPASVPTEGNPTNGNPAEGNPAPADWKAELPEEIRGAESLGKFKSAGDLAKSYLSMEKLIGRKTIGLPDENSSEEDWGKLYNRLGRPETADKYAVKRADGLPPELADAEGTKAFLEVAHKAGLTQKQVNAIFGEYDRQLLDGIKKRTAEAEAQKGAVVSSLRELWGQDMQLRVERAEQTLGVLDPDSKIDREGLKNNVAVIQLLNLFSDRVLGDQLPTKGDAGGISDIEDRLAVLRVSPAFGNEMHADHDRIMTEYKMLMQKRTAMRARP